MKSAARTVAQAARFDPGHPQTIRRSTRAGRWECTRTLGNPRRFTVPTDDRPRKVVADARVSTHDQKKDLDPQEPVLKQKSPALVIKDLGSGMNYKKAGFVKLLGLIVTRQIKELMITRKDRLLRFDSEIIFFLCQHFDVKVTILYETEIKEPREQFCLDVLEVITVCSSKIYGLRAHSNRKTLAKTPDAQL